MRGGRRIEGPGGGRLNAIGRAIGLGAATGMRSLTGAAAFVAARRDDRGHVRRGALGRLKRGRVENRLEAAAGSPLAVRVLQAFAASELVADKLPGIPDRVAPRPFAARALVGAVLGGAVGRRGDRLTTAVAGAAAAIATAYAMYHLRRCVTRATGVPDVAVALAEDAAALGLAWSATRRLR